MEKTRKSYYKLEQQQIMLKIYNWVQPLQQSCSPGPCTRTTSLTIRGHIRRYTDKLVSYFYPYMHIIFYELETEGWFERSKAYVAIERYLSKNSSTQAKRLRANAVKDGQSLVLTMDDHEGSCTQTIREMEVVIDTGEGGCGVEWSSI
ncbi:hypothetical protein KY289_023294 [Solanum tuberosum]|nr:hypothetical protein KY289_023294 [Solanum tuberosum]